MTCSPPARSSRSGSASDDIAAALRADGLATTIGGVFNSFPYTCFAENVGLVRLTRVKSRYVVAAAGVIMILIGLIPKAGAIVAGDPAPGARRRRPGDVRHRRRRRLSRRCRGSTSTTTATSSSSATSLGLAMFVTAQPDVAKAVPDWAQIIFGSGITLGSLTAIVLNALFHHVGKSRGPAVAGQPGDLIRLDQVNEMDREEFVRTFGRPVPGAELGGRSGPTTCGRSRTPTTCAAPSRRPCSPATTPTRSAAHRVLPRPRLAPGRRGRGGPGLAARPVRPRPDPPRRERARRPGRADRRPTASGSASRCIACVRDEDSFEQVMRHGWHRLENSPDAGARRGPDRDRQDRRPPVRRPRGRRQPDPQRPQPSHGGRVSADLDAFNALPEDEAEGPAAVVPGRAPVGRGRPVRPALPRRRVAVGPGRGGGQPPRRRRAGDGAGTGTRASASGPPRPGTRRRSRSGSRPGSTGSDPDVARRLAEGNRGLRAALRPRLPHPGRRTLRA